MGPRYGCRRSRRERRLAEAGLEPASLRRIRGSALAALQRSGKTAQPAATQALLVHASRDLSPYRTHRRRPDSNSLIAAVRESLNPDEAEISRKAPRCETS